VSRPSFLAFLLLAALGACAGEEDYIIVTVDGRAAVHDIKTLKVTLSNAGTMRTDDLPFGEQQLPVTFSVSAPGRTGELGVTVEGIDKDGLLVGIGAATSTLDLPTANILLDSADFVINTDYAENQFPSDDYEAHGFQVSAAPDGSTWTAAYRDSCSSPCNMFARRFDKAGRPVQTKVAASANGFPMSTTPTTSISTPAIATAGNNTIEAWDFNDPTATTTTVGIACRALDATGQANTDQVTIATDPSSDVVAVAPLANGNFAVAWGAFISTGVVRSAVVRSDCVLLAGPSTVSTTASARKITVATLGTSVMYAFVIDGGVRVRFGNTSNVFTTPTDLQFLPRTATESVESVRVAQLGTGFAVVVRWAVTGALNGPGRIELYRTNATGAMLGSPVLVSNKSGSDAGSSEAFGVAARSDGVLMVTWHSCLTNGDGSGCGVWGRAFRENGTPVGDEFLIPTTTAGDQSNPSVAPLGDAFVVVWKDDSAQAPDVAGSSIRGRIIYPTQTPGGN
jgi:hypothetical protein